MDVIECYSLDSLFHVFLLTVRALTIFFKVQKNIVSFILVLYMLHSYISNSVPVGLNH